MGTSDAAAADERAALIERLEQVQQVFERRALSAMAAPLISTSLTMQQLKVLALVAVDPGRAAAHHLAPLLGVTVATMSGIVDRLVDHGMVQRVEDAHDRRVRRLVVTAAGSGTVRELLSAAGTLPTPVLRRLALDDLRALVQGVLAIERLMQEPADGEAAG